MRRFTKPSLSKYNTDSIQRPYRVTSIISERDIPQGEEDLKLQINIFGNKQTKHPINSRNFSCLFFVCVLFFYLFFFSLFISKAKMFICIPSSLIPQVYRIEQNKTTLLALNLEKTITARAHAQFSKLHLIKTHFHGPWKKKLVHLSLIYIEMTYH